MQCDTRMGIHTYPRAKKCVDAYMSFRNLLTKNPNFGKDNEFYQTIYSRDKPAGLTDDYFTLWKGQYQTTIDRTKVALESDDLVKRQTNFDPKYRIGPFYDNQSNAATLKTPSLANTSINNDAVWSSSNPNGWIFENTNAPVSACAEWCNANPMCSAIEVTAGWGNRGRCRMYMGDNLPTVGRTGYHVYKKPSLPNGELYSNRASTSIENPRLMKPTPNELKDIKWSNRIVTSTNPYKTIHHGEISPNNHTNIAGALVPYDYLTVNDCLNQCQTDQRCWAVVTGHNKKDENAKWCKFYGSSYATTKGRQNSVRDPKTRSYIYEKDTPCVFTYDKWKDCTQKCGTGSVQTRNIKPLYPVDANVDTELDPNGVQTCKIQEDTYTETRDCPVVPCQVDCVTDFVSTPSECSKDCGGGIQTFDRRIVTQGANGGRSCPSPDSDFMKEKIVQSCNTHVCTGPKVDCEVTEWGAPYECDPKTGRGKMDAKTYNQGKNGGRKCTTSDLKGVPTFCDVDCIPIYDCGECTPPCGGESTSSGKKKCVLVSTVPKRGNGKECNAPAERLIDCDNTRPCESETCVMQDWSSNACTANCLRRSNANSTVAAGRVMHTYKTYWKKDPVYRLYTDDPRKDGKEVYEVHRRKGTLDDCKLSCSSRPNCNFFRRSKNAKYDDEQATCVLYGSKNPETEVNSQLKKNTKFQINGCEGESPPKSIILNCPENSAIDSVSVKYGRWDNNVCLHNTVTRNTPPSFRVYTTNAHVGKQSANMGDFSQVIRDVIKRDDPAPNIYKQYQVDYVCQGSSFQTQPPQSTDIGTSLDSASILYSKNNGSVSGDTYCDGGWELGDGNRRKKLRCVSGTTVADPRGSAYNNNPVECKDVMANVAGNLGSWHYQCTLSGTLPEIHNLKPKCSKPRSALNRVQLKRSGNNFKYEYSCSKTNASKLSGNLTPKIIATQYDGGPVQNLTQFDIDCGRTSALTSFVLTSDPHYAAQYECQDFTTPAANLATCRDLNTPNYPLFDKSIATLPLHNIACNSDEVLTRIKFNVDNASDTGSYAYRCCK